MNHELLRKKSARNNESLSSNYSDSTPDAFRIKSLFCARNGSKKLYSTVSFQNFGRRKGFTSTSFAYSCIPHYLSFYSSWDRSRKILSNSPKSGRGVSAPSSITKYQSRRLYLLQWNKNVGKRRQPPVENRKKLSFFQSRATNFVAVIFPFNFSCFYLLSLWKEF